MEKRQKGHEKARAGLVPAHCQACKRPTLPYTAADFGAPPQDGAPPRLDEKGSGQMARDVKKVVLAYSGGLDTSVILKWLQETYGCEVITFTADLGQGEELEPARKKAEMFGIKHIHIEDLREEF